ncbi:MAG: hypothetical protein ABL863_12520, partial [Nitrosomonas sp.]
YKRYIRILDALFSKGSHDGKVSQVLKDEILDMVFHKQERENSMISNHIAAARMLRNNGYIRIIGCKIKHPRPDDPILERLLQHPNMPSSFKVDLRNLNWLHNRTSIERSM